jgi:hypothetical protein
MEDILFSRNMFFVGETDPFIPGEITFIESINYFILYTKYREIIIIN